MAWGPEQLLAAWESGSTVPPIARTALLLTLDGRVEDVGTALALDIGRAADLLAESYRDSFGDRLDLVVSCPDCGAALEATIAVPTTTARPATALAGAWELRAPTLAELDEATATADPDAMLRARCLSPLTSDAAPPSTAQLDAALDQVSGTAALHGQVACAECDSTFDSGLDIAALLWHRICAAAPRVLEDVAALASAFGWSEAAILALPASRRTHYLSLAGATG